MQIREIDSQSLPFYKHINLHEYDKEKKKYLIENKGKIAEVSYFSSFGKQEHIFLVMVYNVKYEVRYKEGEVVEVRTLKGKSKMSISPLIESLLENYISQNEWIVSDDINTGKVKVENQYINYGFPLEEYEPTYRSNSCFYEIY